MNRATLILAWAILLLGTAAFYTTGATLSFFALICVDGLIAMAWVISAGLLGMSLLRWGGAAAPGTLGMATSAAAGLGLMSLAALGLGLAGLLGRFSAIGLGAVGPLLFIADLLRRHGNASLETISREAERWLHGKPEAGWPWLSIAPIVGMTIVAASLPPGFLWAGDPVPYDALEYHLQIPREWFDAGRIVPLHHNAFSYFPFNVEMHYLLAMHLRGGPWAGMYLAHYLTLAHMAIAVLAVHGIVRQSWPGPRSALAAAVAAGTMALVPWVPMLASVAYNEAGLLLYGTLCIGWATRAMEERPVRNMVVAGAMAGLAAGTKYTAVPMLILAVALVWGIAAMLARRMMTGRMIIAGCAFVLAGAVLVSPWLIRNFAWTGNPVFPEAMRLFGPGHFSPEQVTRWERAHSPRPDQRAMSQRLAALWREVLLDARYGRVLWPLALAGAVLVIRRPQTWFLLGMLGALVVFWLGLTHLQSRFFVLGVPIAAMLAAGIAEFAWPRLAAAAALIGLLLAGGIVLHRSACPTMQRFAEAGAFGFQDLSVFLPIGGEQVHEGAKIALAGDAQAFLYTVPMSRLKYRTVFDLDTRGGVDPLSAWLGQPADAVLRDHHVIIFPGEMRRFHRSYHAVPLPAAWAEAEAPIILPPELP